MTSADEEGVRRMREQRDALLGRSAPALVVNSMPPNERQWFFDYARAEWARTNNPRDGGEYGFALAHIFKEFRDYQLLKTQLGKAFYSSAPEETSASNDEQPPVRSISGQVLFAGRRRE